jgi:hypothetical protein
MSFPLLEMADSEAGEFVATSACQQNSKQCPITFALDLLVVWCLPESLRLVGRQPVAQPKAQFLYALDASDSAAKSALRSPQSAASYARRRTAPSRRLIVPGARWRDSRCIR